MILIDTDLLLELAAAMHSANEQITDAVQYLNRTIEHNDWGCRERVSINENTARNKLSARSLQESSASFSNAVTYIANEFVIAEKSISDLFGDADAAISRVLSGNSSVTAGNQTTLAADVLRQLQNSGNNVAGSSVLPASYTLSTMTDSIPICSFDSISLGNGG